MYKSLQVFFAFISTKLEERCEDEVVNKLITCCLVLHHQNLSTLNQNSSNARDMNPQNFRIKA